MPEAEGRGQVLGGKFRLVETFASDPLLEVWLAEDLELHRQVVVKILHPRWMDDDAMVERFRFEALAAARVDHANVARTFDVERIDGKLFTVSEYVDGPTVADLLAAGPYTATIVAALGQQAAAGLAAAHEQDLVHRAICPENLVVTPNGRLCIVDFGSVRSLGEEEPEPVFPEPGMSHYWPPERHAGKQVDDRGDVYALGLVLWEALTGAADVGAPPPRSTTRRLFAGLKGGDPSDPHVRSLLAAATADEPGDRPSAEDFGDGLLEVCGVRPQDRIAELVAAFESEG